MRPAPEKAKRTLWVSAATGIIPFVSHSSEVWLPLVNCRERSVCGTGVPSKMMKQE